MYKGERGNKMKHKVLGNSRWWKVTYINKLYIIFCFKLQPTRSKFRPNHNHPIHGSYGNCM